MRSTILRLALLGAVAAVPAYAQNTTTTPNPAAPGRAAPGAATEQSTAPNSSIGADSRSGATAPGSVTEGASRAVTIDEGTRKAEQAVPGANSFTEAQARSRIEAAGFSGVADLQKDDQGVWRGRAQRNGQQVGVALDYQGNVVGR
jgi:hypothetical protein